LTSQQLLEARATLWRHNADPILTHEDATAWVETHGFQLFLPRKQQLPAPAPSFVEACLGKLEHTPSRSAIEDALDLARRLFTTGDVVPLNLFGALSEEPDFLISREELPWLLSLRADRTWKTAPAGRTSPLHINIWKLLDEQGALTVEEIRSGVGREVTEAAVRRALVELWGTLRVVPRYLENRTEWALVKSAYPKESAKGSTTAQGTALSLFLAGYLRSVIAASEDEVSIFLSPLASRSKVREALHALLTTRQLETVALGPNTLYHVAGELPEFPEVLPPATVEPATEAGTEMPEGTAFSSEPGPGTDRIRKYTPQDSRPERPAREGGFQRGDRRPRPYGERPAAGSRERGGFSSENRSREGFRRDDRGRAGFGRDDRKREGFGSDRREDRPRRDGGAFGDNRRERTPYSGERKPFGQRDRSDRPAGGFRPPFRKPQEEGGAFADNRRSREGSEPGRPDFRRREEGGRRDGDRPRPSFRNREEGDRRSFGKKPFGKPFEKRKPFGDRAREGREDSRPPRGDSDRPARKSFGGPRREFGDRKPFSPREGGGEREQRPYGNRPQGRKPFGDRKPFAPREGDGEREQRPYGNRSEGRKSFGDRKPGFPKREGGKSFGKGPQKGPGKSFGKSFGKGPGKPGGFGKGPNKGFGKGPGKSFGKGPNRGPGNGFGKPQRRPEE